LYVFAVLRLHSRKNGREFWSLGDNTELYGRQGAVRRTCN
jgi:hypothetical protein